ncbi:MAG: DDE-type integrase/transposase/recombinase [Thermofilaceae archaeon]
MAVNETCVKVNGEQYWVYSALDIERNELISVRVYPVRNSLTSKSFFKGVLKYCEGKPEFIVDNAPWLRDALTQLRLAHHHQARGLRSLIESAFSSFKQRTKTFFNKITVNLKTQPKPKMEKSGRMLEPILQNIHILLQPPKR